MPRVVVVLAVCVAVWYATWLLLAAPLALTTQTSTVAPQPATFAADRRPREVCCRLWLQSAEVWTRCGICVEESAPPEVHLHGGAGVDVAPAADATPAARMVWGSQQLLEWAFASFRPIARRAADTFVHPVATGCRLSNLNVRVRHPTPWDGGLSGAAVAANDGGHRQRAALTHKRAGADRPSSN